MEQTLRVPAYLPSGIAGEARRCENGMDILSCLSLRVPCEGSVAAIGERNHPPLAYAVQTGGLHSFWRRSVTVRPFLSGSGQPRLPPGTGPTPRCGASANGENVGLTPGTIYGIL
jgi:hypothetical protein